MTTRIYAMTHKLFLKPEDGLYIPLHVGKVNAGDFGYIGDDTGDNISDLNPYYGELTGVYWVWKNDCGSDNIGICHYRRFFADEDRKLLKESDYESILKEYDIIVSKGMQTKGSYQKYYGQAHNPKDLELIGQAVLKLYPEDYPVFTRVIEQSKYYYGNLMVTSRKLFFEYAAWLFSILEEAGRYIDVSSYDIYNQRVFGFLSEQLLLVFITKRRLKAYECTVLITAEKAETVELKLAMGQLIKLGEIRQAREMFYEFIKLRPDVQLELSDVKGEIPVIEQLLYIMEQEEEHGIWGLRACSGELTLLIRHLKKLRGILKEASGGRLTEENKVYCLDMRVSYLFVLVLLLNAPFEKKEKENIAHTIQVFFAENGKAEDAKALEGVQF